jgi:tetratricopeptide (TPR) repeat protein
MRKFRLILLCVLAVPLVALTAAHTNAQTLYDIEGIVEGPDASPLSAVAVYLEDITRARLQQTMTASDGRYRFSRIGAGTYFVVAKPNSTQFRGAVRRVELIDTGRSGPAANEKVDFSLEAVARRDGMSGIVFAQEVPAEAIAKFEHALEGLAKKKTAQAIQDLNEALRIFPNYFMAAQQLGLTYVEIEDYQKAIPPLVKAIEINGKAGASFLGLGIASLKLGRADLALEALERAKAFDEKSFRVHFYLGLTQLELNRLEAAESSLKTAYQLGGPTKAASARLYLASIYTKRGQNRRAIDELEGYLRDSPKAANALSVRQAISNLKSKL